MVKIKVTRGGESVSLEAPAELMQASDDQIKSFVNETFRHDPPIGADFQIERTAEGIIVHPAPQYG